MRSLILTFYIHFHISILNTNSSFQDTMTILKAKDYPFPELKEADAMFAMDTAPHWTDGKKCHRCRDDFTFTNRKHHCRNCGQVFCGQCTSKQCPLPKFGIEKDVSIETEKIIIELKTYIKRCSISFAVHFRYEFVMAVMLNCSDPLPSKLSLRYVRQKVIYQLST